MIGELIEVVGGGDGRELDDSAGEGRPAYLLELELFPFSMKNSFVFFCRSFRDNSSFPRLAALQSDRSRAESSLEVRFRGKQKGHLSAIPLAVTVMGGESGLEGSGESDGVGEGLSLSDLV